MKIDKTFALMRTIAKCVTVVGCFYCVHLIAADLAGKDTRALVDVLFKMQLDRWVAYTVAAIAAGGYAVQRRANKKIVANKRDYIKQLEAAVNPARQSSGLGPIGQASKEDLDGA